MNREVIADDAEEEMAVVDAYLHYKFIIYSGF